MLSKVLSFSCTCHLKLYCNLLLVIVHPKEWGWKQNVDEFLSTRIVWFINFSGHMIWKADGCFIKRTFFTEIVKLLWFLWSTILFQYHYWFNSNSNSSCMNCGVLLWICVCFQCMSWLSSVIIRLLSVANFSRSLMFEFDV